MKDLDLAVLQNKLEGVELSVNVAKRRLVRLESLKSINALSKAESYELDMTIECIRKGEQILRENGRLK